MKRQFGVMAVHNLKETMARNAVDFPRECRIFEVCNPHQAKKALERRMEIATALPCRIAVYSDGEAVTLSIIRPTNMLAMFGHDEALAPVAEEVEKVIVDIIDEAAA